MSFGGYDYTVTLDCLHCGRPVATFTVPSLQTRVVVPRPVRCGACGGPALAQSEPTRNLREVVIEEEEQPRLGRPPKREGQPAKRGRRCPIDDAEYERYTYTKAGRGVVSEYRCPERGSHGKQAA
jgi:hypothetical protein